MPRVGNIISWLRKAKYLTTLDQRTGFHDITFDKDVNKKTSFIIPFGKYEFLKVPFGLAQALAYFLNLMNKVLKGLNFTLAYLNDTIIYSKTA